MLLPARWKKILKDMWGSKSRSLLVILSIAIGIAAVGMINNAARMVTRDLYLEWDAGNPALLEIYVSPFGEQLARNVEGLREVSSAQARRLANASIQSEQSDWEDLTLNVMPDFADIHVNRFAPDSGSAVPGLREILIERQSAEHLAVQVGDRVLVETADDRQYELLVSGLVHDVYVRPFSLLGEINAYVSMETLSWMGMPAYYNRLDIVTSGADTSKDYVLEMGNTIRDRVIEPGGYRVSRSAIPGIGSEPGTHWAERQMQGFLLILRVMSVLAILLSGGLVINTVSAMLSQQIKQIGIMRSVGGVRSQLIVMYLVNVLIFGLLGLALALPLGLAGAWWLNSFAGGFLNYEVTQVDLPFEIWGVQALLALLMPTIVALAPILSGTRISVYDAIYQYGLGNEEGDRVTSLMSKFRSLNPLLMLSMRNTFRKKGRLALTLITLTLAGAMFMAVFSTRASLTAQVNQIERYLYYDATMSVPGGANRRTVEREALRVPGIRVAEGWSLGEAVRLRPNGGESGTINLVGLVEDAQTVRPLLLSGTWLNSEYPNGVVINDDLLESDADLQVGSSIEIKTGDRKGTYEVIGVASKHLVGPRIYMLPEAFAKQTGRLNQADTVRVLADASGPSSPELQQQLANRLEERFDNAGLSQSSASTRADFFGSFTDVFDIILVVLIIMAGILAAVGGLGLTGTMGMNVLERIREIGVLRAVGASNFAVRQVVVVEGVMVGLVSWAFGAALSHPTGQALAAAVVSATLEADLIFVYSYLGLFVWLGIVLLIGVGASLAPARSAVSLKVREVLDYE
ncbi:MAG TPA: ABC transporter permease [Anaerolineales bacterium]|nr:ABC transporter permease [Anaerolineales bacterium]